MNNKEIILKRLLEEKHITIEEMFLLNKTKTTLPINSLLYYPILQKSYTLDPYYTSNCTEMNNNVPLDYKMD
jgi:hypothetical protein